MKGRAVGGYVRRCDRHQVAILDPIRMRRWGMSPFEITYQSMPVLRFEQFDVEEPIDRDDTPTIGSIYERFQGHHTDRA